MLRISGADWPGRRRRRRLSQWVMNLINNRITYRVVRDIRKRGLPANSDPAPDLSGQPPHRRGGQPGHRATWTSSPTACCMGFTQLFTGVVTIVGTLVFMLSDQRAASPLVVVLITPAVPAGGARSSPSAPIDMFRLQSEIRGEQTGFIDEMIGRTRRWCRPSAMRRTPLEQFDEINERLRKCTLRAIFFSSITNPATRFVNAVVYAGVGTDGRADRPSAAALPWASSPAS